MRATRNYLVKLVQKLAKARALGSGRRVADRKHVGLEQLLANVEEQTLDGRVFAAERARLQLELDLGNLDRGRVGLRAESR